MSYSLSIPMTLASSGLDEMPDFGIGRNAHDIINLVTGHSDKAMPGYDHGWVIDEVSGPIIIVTTPNLQSVGEYFDVDISGFPNNTTNTPTDFVLNDGNFGVEYVPGGYPGVAYAGQSKSPSIFNQRAVADSLDTQKVTITANLTPYNTTYLGLGNLFAAIGVGALGSSDIFTLINYAAPGNFFPPMFTPVPWPCTVATSATGGFDPAGRFSDCFIASLTQELDPGVYVVQVKAVDIYGRYTITSFEFVVVQSKLGMRIGFDIAKSGTIYTAIPVVDGASKSVQVMRYRNGSTSREIINTFANANAPGLKIDESQNIHVTSYDPDSHVCTSIVSQDDGETWGPM